jgi:hypothetical protein
MWRKIISPVLETRHSGAGGAPTEAYKGNRNRQGLYRESEGLIVLFEAPGHHNPEPREGALLCSRNRRVEDKGIAAVLLTPENIRTLQRKLYRKAKQDPAFRQARASTRSMGSTKCRQQQVGRMCMPCGEEHRKAVCGKTACTKVKINFI